MPPRRARSVRRVVSRPPAFGAARARRAPGSLHRADPAQEELHGRDPGTAACGQRGPRRPTRALGGRGVGEVERDPRGELVGCSYFRGGARRAQRLHRVAAMRDVRSRSAPARPAAAGLPGTAAAERRERPAHERARRAPVGFVQDSHLVDEKHGPPLKASGRRDRANVAEQRPRARRSLPPPRIAPGGAGRARDSPAGRAFAIVASASSTISSSPGRVHAAIQPSTRGGSHAPTSRSSLEIARRAHAFRGSSERGGTAPRPRPSARRSPSPGAARASYSPRTRCIRANARSERRPLATPHGTWRRESSSAAWAHSSVSSDTYGCRMQALERARHGAGRVERGEERPELRTNGRRSLAPGGGRRRGATGSRRA